MGSYTFECVNACVFIMMVSKTIATSVAADASIVFNCSSNSLMKFKTATYSKESEEMAKMKKFQGQIVYIHI